MENISQYPKQEAISSISRCEIIDYVGKLQIEDKRTIATRLIAWKQQKAEGDSTTQKPSKTN